MAKKRQEEREIAVERTIKTLKSYNEKLIRTKNEEKQLKLAIGAEGLKLYNIKGNIFFDGSMKSPRQLMVDLLKIEPKQVDEIIAAARAIDTGTPPETTWKNLVIEGRKKLRPEILKKVKIALNNASHETLNNSESEQDSWDEENNEVVKEPTKSITSSKKLTAGQSSRIEEIENHLSDAANIFKETRNVKTSRKQAWRIRKLIKEISQSVSELSYEK